MSVNFLHIKHVLKKFDSIAVFVNNLYFNLITDVNNLYYNLIS